MTLHESAIRWGSLAGSVVKAVWSDILAESNRRANTTAQGEAEECQADCGLRQGYEDIMSSAGYTG